MMDTPPATQTQCCIAGGGQAVQNEVLSPVLARSDAPQRPPAAVRLLQRLPVLRRLPARVIGIGVRPERVRMA
jgi:hypothetical protein